MSGTAGTPLRLPAEESSFSVGILAYGSLIADPGDEMAPLIARRVPTVTPFPVEFARLSGTRGGAPTVVPYSSGLPVTAEVLVLRAMSVDEARSLLWRRETRSEGSGKSYREPRSSNSVVIRDWPGLAGVTHVLYTDFNPDGKIFAPNPETLARAAIESVRRAPAGRDGVSYLISLLEAGVETALTPRYIAAILSQTGATDLGGAVRQLTTIERGVSRHG